MSLTTAQQQTLKAAILAASPALNLEDYGAIAEWLNAATTFVVWRPQLTSAEARAAISGGDGLAQLDNLTAGKRDSLLWVFNDTTYPSNAAQRDAIVNLCGTQNLLKAAILAAQKRVANKAESLLATGTGSDASPGTLTFEGTVDIYQIGAILSA